jgi:serine/threonine-protein kinase RsbW
MPVSRTRTFPGRFDSLDAIRDFAAEAAESAGLGKDAAYEVQLAVDEACSNIIEHAYGGEGLGDIECTCLIQPGKLTVKLHDRGETFDPSCVPQPDLECALEQRQTGGLGLVLMYKLMDEIYFDPDDSGNTLTLVKFRS